MTPSSPVRRSSPPVRQRTDTTQLASSPPPYIGGERRGGHHDRDTESRVSSPERTEPFDGMPTRRSRRTADRWPTHKTKRRNRRPTPTSQTQPTPWWEIDNSATRQLPRRPRTDRSKP